jgi:GDPmannose 4,6-dehydratase
VKRALVTGITGQDGSYLAELLLEKNYDVHGIIRRSSSFNTGRIDHLYHDPHETGAHLRLHYGDLSDIASISRVLQEFPPDEVYNLGAMSMVKTSFEIPDYTGMVTGLGAVKLFEAVREHCPRARVYQASSSEMWGSTPPPQNERTPFHPRSPYAAAKAYAHNSAVNMREAYGMFIACGILCNHESPRRGETFVTRKISAAVARIAAGMQKHLYLGNLEAKRDWGFAGDYVKAMWLMLQQDSPDDFVIATGESHTVREFCQAAFEHVGLDWKHYVKIDPVYFRPSEVDALRGDASKAERLLGWKPRVRFEQLVKMMVDADVDALHV